MLLLLCKYQVITRFSRLKDVIRLYGIVRRNLELLHRFIIGSRRRHVKLLNNLADSVTSARFVKKTR